MTQSTSPPGFEFKTARGFSLVETLIATALMALVVSGGVLYLTSIRRHTRLLNETDAFRLFLERVYAHTCSYQEIIRIDLSEYSATAVRGANEILLTHNFHRGFSLRFEPGQSRQLFIYPSLSSSPATLHIQGGEEECSIVMSLRSRYRVEC